MRELGHPIFIMGDAAKGLVLACCGGEGGGLAAGALLEVSVQSNGAVEGLAGGGRIVAGECDLGDVVEGCLLLGRVSCGGNALEGRSSFGQFVEMHLADAEIELRGEAVAGGCGDAAESGESRCAVADQISLHAAGEAGIFALPAKICCTEWRKVEIG